MMEEKIKVSLDELSRIFMFINKRHFLRTSIKKGYYEGLFHYFFEGDGYGRFCWAYRDDVKECAYLIVNSFIEETLKQMKNTWKSQRKKDREKRKLKKINEFKAKVKKIVNKTNFCKKYKKELFKNHVRFVTAEKEAKYTLRRLKKKFIVEKCFKLPKIQNYLFDNEITTADRIKRRLGILKYYSE